MTSDLPLIPKDKDALTRGTVGISILFGAAFGALIGFPSQWLAMSRKERNGDNTFYWNQPLTIVAVFAAIFFLVALAFYISETYEWKRINKPYGYRVTLDQEDQKYSVLLIHNGEPVSHEQYYCRQKWNLSQYPSTIGGKYDYSVSDGYFNDLMTACQKGQEMVDLANKHMRTKEIVLIEDSTKRAK